MRLSHYRPLGLAAVLGLSTALPVSAVTPEEVWAFWQELGTSFDYTITASAERRDGDRLLLDDVLVATQNPAGTARIPVGTVVMRDRGDGAVEITIPNSVPMEFTVTEPDAEPVSVSMRLEHEDMVTVISGDAGAIASEATARQMQIIQDSATVAGAPIPMAMTFTLENVSSLSQINIGEMLELGGAMQIGIFGATVDATDPDTDSKMAMTATGRDYQMEFASRMGSDGLVNAEISHLLANGMALDAKQTVGPVEFTVAMVEDAGETRGEGRMATIDAQFRMNAEGFDYGAGATGIAIKASGAQVPLPDLEFTAAEYRLGLGMPLLASDNLADARLLIRLVDLAVPDAIWAMGDPMGQLSRGPVTAIADLSGKVRLLRDLVAPEGLAGDESPGEVHAADLNELRVSAAGAELTGAGGFTFDNDDVDTFDGFPRPAGSVELKLTGGNALIDNLVAMGLLPEDEVMGYRMMLAMFTKAGDGPDTMTSKIEFTPEGRLLANGQQLQ